MNTDTKPLKRNRNLVLFSHEHHHALVFINHLVNEVSNSADINTLREQIIYLWENQLQLHFNQEEKYFIPLVDRNINIVQQFYNEHAAIKNILTHFYLTPSIVYTEITLFANLLKAHIRFEEREFFPYLEDRLTEQQLIAIGEKLIKQNHPCSN